MLSLGGDHFNGNVDVAAELANSLANSTVPSSATVYIQGGNITSSVLFPLIAGGSSYYLDYGDHKIRGGGTLTITSGITIGGRYLYISDDGTAATRSQSTIIKVT